MGAEAGKMFRLLTGFNST